MSIPCVGSLTGVLVRGLGILILVLMMGCTSATDYTTDLLYNSTCSMPYATEERFLANNQLSRETLQEWCKRLSTR
jgi:hypothetical protein